MAEIKAKKVIFKNRDGEHLIPYVGDTAIDHRITNCLLEVPQRIKYTLENGTLTVKAGSVVIVPYGTTDRTSEFPVGSTFANNNFKVYDTQFANGKFFVWVELVSDTSNIRTSTDTNERPLYVNLSVNTINAMANNSSGTQDILTGNQYIYRTDLNICHQIGNSILTADVVSLPIARVVADGTNLYGSVTQIFNGMGYIGSTIWVDKGIKCLIPNGRNEDGSLNNIEHTTSKVGILNAGTSNAKFYAVIDTSKGEGVFLPSYSSIGKTRYYDSETNYWYINATNGTGGEKAQWCMLSGYIYTGNNKIITSASFNKPFRAVDYSQVDGQWVVKYLLASTATAIGTYVLDLSDYLPNDDYNYEVMMTMYADRSGDTKGDNSFVSVYNDDFGVNGADSGGGKVNSFFSVVLDGANFQQQCSGGLAIITANRQLKFDIKNYKLSNFALNAIAYRRLGIGG